MGGNGCEGQTRTIGHRRTEVPPVQKSTIMLAGFRAKIGGVLRDAASTAIGGLLTFSAEKRLRSTGKSPRAGIATFSHQDQVLPSSTLHCIRYIHPIQIPAQKS